MRVLLVNDHYKYGGAEKYVRQLGTRLSRDHEVATLTLDGADGVRYTVTERSDPLSKLRNRYGENGRIERKVREVVEHFEPDIVHLHKNSIAPISVLNALQGERVIKTVHDFGFVSADDKYAYEMNRLERGIRKMLEISMKKRLRDRLSKTVSLYIAPSGALMRELTNNRYEPVEHVPNFVERRDPKFGGEYFLYVGRLEAGKAPDLLVDAYTKAGDTVPSLKLVGEGQMKQEIERRIREQSIQDSVSLEGFVSEQRLRELYRNSKGVVIPSRWRENNPLVAIEAKAYGNPLIVSNRGGLPELVQEGETGFVFDSEDASALAEMLSQGVDWSSLGERSYRDYVDNYTPEKHLDTVLERYDRVKPQRVGCGIG